MTDRPIPDPRDIWQQGEAEGGPRRPAGQSHHPGAPRRPAARQRPRRSAWRATALWGGLVLACLGIAGVVFFFVASPLDAVRDRLIERVNARIGGTLVAGPASLSLFPRPVVSFSDVAVLTPGASKETPLATVPSLEVEVSLWSLLLRQPQVGRLTLYRPAILFSVDAEGRRNWEINAKRTPRSDTGNAADAGNPPASPDPGAPSPKASLAQKIAGGTVRIVDATLRYRDERSGDEYEISALNLELAAEDREGPVALEGSLTWRGVPLRIAGKASPLRIILGGQPAELGLEVKGAPLAAAYAGTLSLKGGIASNGRISLEAASARTLADWLGLAWAESAGADALAFKAQIETAGASVTLSSLEASLGDVKAAGSLVLHLEGRPKVSGKLEVSELDLGTLLARRTKPGDAPAPPFVPSPAAPKAPKGWSEEVIDPKRLGLADADLVLSAGRLVYKGVKAGPATLTLTVQGGVAKAAFEAVDLYGGKGKGRLTLDGSAAVLGVAADLELVGVALEPLLAGAAGVTWLGGRGTVALTLSGRGNSERQIVEGLDGKAEVAVADGALIGIDVGKIVRTVQRGRLPSLKVSREERTAFSEMTGKLDIAKGVARSRELKLTSPNLHVKGEGVVELGPRRIDYTLNAKIAGAPPAEGAVINIGTIEIPVGIKGPLEAPAFSVMGHEALGDAIKQIGKNLKSHDVQDAVKGLLQGDSGEKRKARRDLIDKLLKKD
jgi:AsmA protein